MLSLFKKGRSVDAALPQSMVATFAPRSARAAAVDGGGNTEHSLPGRPDALSPTDQLPESSLGKEVIVKTIEEFAALPLPFESLIEDLQLGDHLLFNVRPVIFGGPKGSGAARACLLVNEAYAKSDEANELLQILCDTKKWGASWQLWAFASRIVVPDALLLALGRGDINKETLGNKRKITTDKKRHSFFLAFSDIVAFAVRENASDIHFNLDFQQSYSQVMFTINGRYVGIEKYRMATPTMLQILNVAWMSGTGGNGAYFDTRIEQQCRVNLDVEKQAVMLRWASVSCEYPGPSVTMRVVKLNQQGVIPSLEDLSYLPDQVSTFERAMNSEKGAIVMVGVVGSGKSYTLASLMSRLPAHRKKMGAEDPVEIIIPGMLQKSINRALEGDTGREFEAFGKTIKRSAMNDVLLGEIRDPATGAFFVDVVLMGTSFYTTTHAPSALGAYDKLSSDMVGVSRDFLATPGHIKLITYQALLPKLCSCAIPVTSLARQSHAEYRGNGTTYLNRIEQLYDLDLERIKIRNPDGCEKCKHHSIPELNGFRGRTLAAEMVEPDETLLTLVKQGDSIGMIHHMTDLRGQTRFDDPRMVGKTAMECAVYKMSLGEIDPRELEPRFHSFEREEMLRRTSRPPANNPVMRGLNIVESKKANAH